MTQVLKSDESRAGAGGVFNRLIDRLGRWLAAATLRDAEDRARQAEARLRDVVEAIPEGVVFLDAEGRYILWNQTYAEIYHDSADLFRVGARLVDTLRVGIARGGYPDAVGREEEWLAARMALLENPGERHEQRLADGRWLMIEERKTSEGGVIGLRVDITDMKRQAQVLEAALHRAEAANEAKTEFLANLSHEIRTPLNGVLGMADVMARTPLAPLQRDIVQTIATSAEALNQVLSDLLDFSQLESGRLEIVSETFDLETVVADCQATYDAIARRKKLGLVVEVAEAARRRVTGDPNRLRQILANLISNALKFTDRGRVAVHVDLDEAGRCRFVVSDTGRGFAPEEAERLFARFEQADGSSTRLHGGLGLGLAICRQLAERMGGTISATAQPGAGAVFTLVLPLRSPEGEATDPPALEASQSADTAGGALRVLVTDDNATNRMVAELIMASIGAEVTCAENGQEAVNAFDQSPFDVVLMDLQMPVMDGLTATRAIRELEAERGLSRTPVVVVSANIMPEQRAASAAAGADDHLGKPVRAEELIAAVVRVIQGSDLGPDLGPNLRDCFKSLA
jgi:signal transduction histidine kinase/AmiR/NasT family two-component response regulator